MDDEINQQIRNLALNVERYTDCALIVYYIYTSIPSANTELQQFSFYMLGTTSGTFPMGPITQDDIDKLTRLLQNGYNAIMLEDAEVLNGRYEFQNSQYRHQNNSTLSLQDDTLSITTQSNDGSEVRAVHLRGPLPDSVIFYVFILLFQSEFFEQVADDLKNRLSTALQDHKVLNLLYLVVEMSVFWHDLKVDTLSVTQKRTVLEDVHFAIREYERRNNDNPGAVRTFVTAYENHEVFEFLQEIYHTLLNNINEIEQQLGPHSQGEAAMVTDDDPGASSMFCLRLTLPDNCKHTEQKV